jgi:intein-encoded DNA endonuclease-like protein
MIKVKEKNLNVKVTDYTLENLKFIQEYYSKKLGVKVSQREAISRLLSETAMLIKNTGETYPGRTWEFLNYEAK